MLYHCTAGKDRTGLMTAVLLTALGAPRDQVYAGHLRTNQELPESNAETPEQLRKLGYDGAAPKPTQARNTACYVMVMANTRFSISTDPEVHAEVKAHADAAGLDVSAYMIAAAVAQMAADDAAAAAFAPLDADNAAALDEAAMIEAPPLPAFEDLTAEEQLLVRRVLASALGTGQADVA